MSFYFAYNTPQIDDLINEKYTKMYIGKDDSSMVNLNAAHLDFPCNSIEMETLYPREKYHCTMLYSNEESKQLCNNLLNINFPNILVEIKNVTIWNDNNQYFLVAQLESEELHIFHQHIKEKLKNTDIYHPEKIFNPHITLQKSINEKKLYRPEVFSFLVGKKIELSNFHLVHKNKASKLKL